MRLLNETEMKEIVENICNTIVRRSSTDETFDLESCFDEHAEQASIGELYEICRRVQYRCSVNGIVLVRCGDSPSGIQPWKVDYKLQNE